jgi:hypothetical protein
VGVGPVHIWVDVAVAAVALPQLTGHHRVGVGDLGERRSATAVTGGEVVRVVGGDLGLRRVGRQVGEPAFVVARPLGATEHHRLRRPGRAHRFHQFGHPRRAVGADPLVVNLAAVLPAAPVDVVRLVVEVEEDRVVALVRGRDRTPEVGRVIGVGHRDDPGRLFGAGRRPVEVEDHVEVLLLEPRDPGADRAPVALTAVLRRDPVDPEPAGLVQRNPYRVDVPRLHRLDRGGVAGAVEEPVPLLAGVLGAGAVDAEQAHRMPGVVDQVAAADADPRLRRGRRGGEEEDREREDRGARRTAQTATRCGAATLRLNCIAPSSSGA